MNESSDTELPGDTERPSAIDPVCRGSIVGMTDVSSGPDVVGFLRFNIVTATHKRGYQKTRNKSVEDAVQSVLDPVRIERRLALLEAMPLASLGNQTDKDFSVYILISDRLRQDYKDRIRYLEGLHPYLRAIEIGVDDDVQARISSLVNAREPTITFRIDDDDAVGPHLVGDLRASATAANLGKVLSSPHGYYIEPEDRQLLVQPVYYPNIGLGLAYFSADGRTIFHVGSHAELKTSQLVLIDRPNAWLRSIHSGSDSDTRINRRKPFAALDVHPLPEFEFIDFPAVIDALGPVEQASAFRALKGRLKRRLRL